MEKPEVPDTNPLDDFALANGFGALRLRTTVTGAASMASARSLLLNFAVIIFIPLIV